MRRFLAVIASVPLFALVASATGAPGPDWPKAEMFLGYNFVRFNPDSPFIPSFNANGGSGQFVYNVKSWIGAAFEAGAVHKGTIGGFNADSTVVHFVAGPRFTFLKRSRFIPYAEALFGGAYATTSTRIDLLEVGLNPPGLLPPVTTGTPGPPVLVTPGTTFPARIAAARTGFAMFIGGGLDIKVGKHVAIRPAGVDYYLTRVPSPLGGTENQNNFRYMGGVNFLFGGAK